jgi:hypothetical protein
VLLLSIGCREVQFLVVEVQRSGSGSSIIHDPKLDTTVARVAFPGPLLLRSDHSSRQPSPGGIGWFLQACSPEVLGNPLVENLQATIRDVLFIQTAPR